MGNKGLFWGSSSSWGGLDVILLLVAFLGRGSVSSLRTGRYRFVDFLAYRVSGPRLPGPFMSEAGMRRSCGLLLTSAPSVPGRSRPCLSASGRQIPPPLTNPVARKMQKEELFFHGLVPDDEESKSTAQGGGAASGDTDHLGVKAPFSLVTLPCATRGSLRAELFHFEPPKLPRSSYESS